MLKACESHCSEAGNPVMLSGMTFLSSQRGGIMVKACKSHCSKAAKGIACKRHCCKTANLVVIFGLFRSFLERLS